MNKMVGVSIVIVTYNSSQFIENCLRSILSSDFASNCQIIIIDNSSSDLTPKILSKFRDSSLITFVFNKNNLGYTKACNQGIKLSSGKYVLFLNPDTVMKKETIKKMFDYMEKEKEAAVVGGKLVYSDGSLQYSCRTFPNPVTFLLRALKIGNKTKIMSKHLMYDYDHLKTRCVDWVLGSCFMVRKEIFYDVGFFDQKYFLYYSDIDFCWRISRLGFKVFYFPDALLVHYYQRQSAKGFNRTSFFHFKDATRFFLKRAISSFFTPSLDK